jgi:hypothetical protein
MATTLVRIVARRKTAAAWTSSAEVLLAGEFGVETDTLKVKVGDGVTAWGSLAYHGASAAPTGTAGGDLTGSYPNPTLAAVGTAGTYGDGTHVAQLTTDSKGRVTAVTPVAITGAAPSGTAGGDLTGTYPNPTVAKVNGVTVTGTPASGNILRATGSTAAAWGTPTATPVSLTYGATTNTDASLGALFRVTLTGDTTLAAPTNPVDGQRAVWELTASGGARTVTLATGSSGAFKFGTSITTLAAVASGTSTFLGALYRTSSARWHVLAISEGH